MKRVAVRSSPLGLAGTATRFFRAGRIPRAAYDEYAPAYRYGWESRSKYQGRKFDEVESDLGRDWDRAKGRSRLGWENAKQATRDAWHRVERAIPGDADRDGR